MTFSLNGKKSNVENEVVRDCLWFISIVSKSFSRSFFVVPKINQRFPNIFRLHLLFYFYLFCVKWDGWWMKWLKFNTWFSHSVIYKFLIKFLIVSKENLTPNRITFFSPFLANYRKSHEKAYSTMIINQISSKSVNLITLICCMLNLYAMLKCWLVINVNTTVNKCGFHPSPICPYFSPSSKTLFYLFTTDRFSMTRLILIFYALHCMWSSLAFPTLFIWLLQNNTMNGIGKWWRVKGVCGNAQQCGSAHT